MTVLVFTAKHWILTQSSFCSSLLETSLTENVGSMASSSSDGMNSDQCVEAAVKLSIEAARALSTIHEKYPQELLDKKVMSRNIVFGPTDEKGIAIVNKILHRVSQIRGSKKHQTLNKYLLR